MNFDATSFAAAIAAGGSPILWGDPGIGKTSFVQSWARQMGAHLEVVIGSTMMPEDITGIPHANPLTGVAAKLPADWAVAARRRLDDGQKVVVFFDELTTVNEHVQKALLTVWTSRHVAGVDLSDAIWVAAANPTSSLLASGRLLPTTANRFVHFDFVFDLDRWVEGIVVGDWTAGNRVPTVDTDTARRGAAAAHIAAFVKSYRPDLANAMPDTADAAGRAWPSPRSWHGLAEALAWLPAYGTSDEVNASWRALARGYVGDVAGETFVGYVASQDLLSGAEIADRVAADPDSIDWATMPADRRWPQVMAFAAYVTAGDGKAVDRYESCGVVVEAMTRQCQGAMAAWLAKTTWGAHPAEVVSIPAGFVAATSMYAQR